MAIRELEIFYSDSNKDGSSGSNGNIDNKDGSSGSSGNKDGSSGSSGNKDGSSGSSGGGYDDNKGSNSIGSSMALRVSL